MLTIASLTIREMSKKKTLLVAVLLSLAFLAIYGAGLYLAQEKIDETGNPMFKAIIIPQLLSMGLFFASMIVSLLAIFTTVGAISGELDTGVFYAVVSKPLARYQIILGKFMGYSAVLILYSGMLLAGILIMVSLLTGYRVGSPLGAAGIFILQPLVILSLAIFGSTFLSTMANGIFVFLLYGVAVIGGIVEQVGSLIKSDSMQTAGIVTSLLIPVDSLYRKMLATVMSASTNPLAGFQTMGPLGIESEPSLWMLIYTGIYIFCFTFLAVKIFSRKDI